MNLAAHLTACLPRRDPIGLDVGRRAIKAVRRERGRVVARSLVPWDAPSRFEDEDARGRLSDAVRRVVGTFGLSRGHRVMCTLSLSFGELRTFELPPSPEEELREMVRQEFAVEPDFEPGRSEVACWSAPAGRDLQTVCGWALPHAVSRYVSREIGRAGFDCAAIEALPFALARATAELGGTYADNPVAVVDWGARSPSLTVVHRGRPVFTRSLRDQGHEHVVERLSEGLGLSIEEAWEFYDGFGPGSDAAPELVQLLAEYATEVGEGLVGEIERTIEFLGERMRQLAPRAILLYGGGAVAVRESLRAAFGSRVVTWEESVREGDTLPSSHAVAASLTSLEVTP